MERVRCGQEKSKKMAVENMRERDNRKERNGKTILAR